MVLWLEQLGNRHRQLLRIYLATIIQNARMGVLDIKYLQTLISEDFSISLSELPRSQ